MNVLVVEDEKKLADSIREILTGEKIHSDAVYNGEDGYDFAASGIYDVVLLDIMLPKLGGFEVLKKLRLNKISTPVILLTARDDVDDKVKGLDLGGDDYLTKPFSSKELLARIRAVSRRKGEMVIDTVTFGDLELELETLTLKTTIRNISVKLGYKEFEILKLLISRRGGIVSKEEIIVKVWGYLSDAEDNNVEVYMSFLRKKLAFIRSGVLIVSTRKIGYSLEYSEN
ncbi:MAG: response regulator transcription factor [Eubacteriales bacterium]